MGLCSRSFRLIPREGLLAIKWIDPKPDEGLFLGDLSTLAQDLFEGAHNHPSSMGLRFLVRAEAEVLAMRVRWGDHVPVATRESRDVNLLSIGRRE